MQIYFEQKLVGEINHVGDIIATNNKVFNHATDSVIIAFDEIEMGEDEARETSLVVTEYLQQAFRSGIKLITLEKVFDVVNPDATADTVELYNRLYPGV